jgi:signal transduction histidine kinase
MEFEQSGEISDFLQRAQLGTNRLKFILNQLSELSQLKYTLENTPKEKFNLTELCQQLGKSYQSFIPQLRLDITCENVYQNGSNELMAQLLDKLMDNAKDFTPHEGLIELKLKADKENIYLSVTNTGSQLPEHKETNIFDSLITSRPIGLDNNTHLGLGLHIVQLISRFHHGKITALNHKVNNSVEFSLKLKKT